MRQVVLPFLLAAAGFATEISLTRLSPEAQLLPGGVVVHVWQLTNLAERSLSLRLVLEVPPGWEVVGVPAEVLLPPQSTEYVFVTVLVPRTAVAGSHSVRLRAVWNGQERVGEGPVEVRGVAALELAPPTEAASPPGETLSGEVLLRNRGNSLDRVSLEAWTAAGWPTRVHPKEAALAPGEGRPVRVEVNIPAAASPSREVVFLVARSGVEPAVETRTAWYITVLPPGPEKVVGTVLAELAMKAYGRFSFGEELSSHLGVSGRGTVLGGSLELNLRFSGPGAPEALRLTDFFALYDRGAARMEAGRVGMSLGPLLSALGFQGLLGRLRWPSFFLLFGSGWEGRVGRAGGTLRWQPEWGEAGGAYREEKALEMHAQAGTVWLLFHLAEEIALRLEGGAAQLRGLTRFAGLAQISMDIPRLFFSELRGFAAHPGFPSLYRDQLGFLLSGRIGAEAAGLRFSLGLSRKTSDPASFSSGVQVAWAVYPAEWPFSLSFGVELRRAVDARIPPRVDERNLRGEAAGRFTGENITILVSGAWLEHRNFVAQVTRYSAEYRQRLDLKLGEALGAVVELWQRTLSDEGGTLSVDARATLEVFTPALRASFAYGKEGGTLRVSFDWTPVSVLTLSPAAEALWNAQGELARFLFSLGFSYEFRWAPPFLPDKGWVSGWVRADLDGDSQADPDEPGVPGVILSLGGTRVSSGKDGHFKFPPLPPGTYELRVESAPAGYDLPAPRAISVFLNRESQVCLSLLPLARLAGLVFQDLNANGALDPTEAGLARALLRLVLPDGTSREALTDGHGRFLFPDLPPGPHRLELVREALPPRFEVTTKEALALVLRPGETAEALFGVRERPRPVILIQPPLAEFTWTPRVPHVGTPVLFDGTLSQAFAAQIVSYSWDFNGDGVPDAAGPRVTWTFVSPGLHLVELRVTDSRGLTGVVQYLVEVRP